MKIKHFFKFMIVSLWLWANSSLAQNNQTQPANSHTGNPDGAFSWDLSIAIDFANSPAILIGSDQKDAIDFLELNLLIDLYYKGFFLQTNKHRFGGYSNGTELGYELEVNDQYEVDLISKTYLPGFSPIEERFHQSEIPELDGITERKYASMEGIRYMRYLPNAVYWVDWAANWGREHSGWIIDGFYSHILQKRNWDINLGAGVSIYSKKMNAYYFSVKPEEVALNRPIYKAGTGYRVQFEAFIQRPISESWLFKGGVTASHYSKSISDSPLIIRQNVVRAQIGLNYVF